MDALERTTENFRKTIETLREQHLNGGIDTNSYINTIRAQHMAFLQSVLRVKIENRKRDLILARCEQAEIRGKQIAEEGLAAADMTGRGHRIVVAGDAA